MTFFWLFVWLAAGAPYIGGNGWLVALIICAVLDIKTAVSE